ncbi:hypothetical protein [Streptomyces chrestomyceticus]|uniref:hypothetical protein n=1 Tax=Streptomyces chrestomyceticus TaxID=68185 RepID=UPI00379771EF
MSENEEAISAETANYLVFSESSQGAPALERLGSLREVAMWVIDSHDYYLSNETMRELGVILDTGKAACIELPSGTAVTVARTIDPNAIS